MNRYLCVVMLTFCVFASILPLAQAGVISRDWKTPGDGLLTYDDVSRREWLDLSETLLFKFPGDSLQDRYQQVIAETTPGGLFAGFAVAQRNEVFAFGQSAGIDTSTLNFASNQSTASQMIDLISPTLISGANRSSDGVVSDRDLVLVIQAVVAPNGRDAAFAGVQQTTISGVSAGVWLYRNVPEPSSPVFAAFAGLIVAVLDRRRCNRAG